MLCLASGAAGDARGKLRTAKAGSAKAAATAQGQEHPWVPHCSFPGLSPCPGTPKGVTATGMGVKSFIPGLAAGYRAQRRGTGVKGDNSLPVI